MKVEKLMKEFPNSILIDIDKHTIWIITEKGVRLSNDKEAIKKVVDKW